VKIVVQTVTIIMDIAVVQKQATKNVANRTNQVNNPLKIKTMRKRRNGFLIGLAVAVLTFGGLWLGLGPDHFNRGQKLCEQEHCCMMEHHQSNDECKTSQVNGTNDSIAK
jgi:hypothetical protein